MCPIYNKTRKMYRLYQEEDGRYILVLVVKTILGNKEYEFSCNTKEELESLYVPNCPHTMDPGLQASPRIHPNPRATVWECVVENRRIQDRS